MRSPVAMWSNGARHVAIWINDADKVIHFGASCGYREQDIVAMASGSRKPLASPSGYPSGLFCRLMLDRYALELVELELAGAPSTSYLPPLPDGLSDMPLKLDPQARVELGTEPNLAGGSALQRRLRRARAGHL